MSSPDIRNPFKRGKGLILSNLILEGKSNREIEDYYVEMGFDKKYGVWNNAYLYQVRTALKKAGLLDSEGYPIKKASTEPPKPSQTSESVKIESEKNKIVTEEREENTKMVSPIIRRPDWDLLSIEQINQLSDVKMKGEILNYKTDIAKIKQEIKPEFATRGEIDQLRTDIGIQLQGLSKQITEQVNPLVNKKNPKAKVDEVEEDEDNDEDEGINPSVVSTENPLSNQESVVEKPKSRAGENLIEVEKGVIITKLIGFTTKTLMWYELDKTEGLLPNGEAFPGNLADYVNACVEDVHVVRNIGLSLTQRRPVK